uniref:Putative secreted protein n=1 Tax=Anopheles darlingi TaxID=43151 RepID=A0A2M4DPX7_ANODA
MMISDFSGKLFRRSIKWLAMPVLLPLLTSDSGDGDVEEDDVFDSPATVPTNSSPAVPSSAACLCCWCWCWSWSWW